MGGAEGRRERELDQPTNQRTVGVEGTKKANVVRQSASITHPSSGINNTKREKAINGPLITMHPATLAHIREEEPQLHSDSSSSKGRWNAIPPHSC